MSHFPDADAFACDTKDVKAGASRPLLNDFMTNDVNNVSEHGQTLTFLDILLDGQLRSLDLSPTTNSIRCASALFHQRAHTKPSKVLHEIHTPVKTRLLNVYKPEIFITKALVNRENPNSTKSSFISGWAD